MRFAKTGSESTDKDENVREENKRMIQKFRYIFSRTDKFKLVGLVVLMIIGSVLELLAVAVFNPFIEVMMQTSSIADDSFYSFSFNIRISKVLKVI